MRYTLIKDISGKMDDKVLNELERLLYEFSRLKDNILYLLDTRRYDASILDSELFKSYEDRQSKLYAEYSILVNNILNLFIEPKYRFSFYDIIVDTYNKVIQVDYATDDYSDIEYLKSKNWSIL